MIDPKFLLQAGDVLSAEKFACTSTLYYCKHATIGQLSTLHINEHKFNYVPVGSVEFTKEYCKRVGLKLPENSLSYFGAERFLKRNLRQGTYADAKKFEFVKPVSVKTFTGNIKNKIEKEIDPDTDVWISEPVPYGSEFRFYIQDYVTEPEILGWARYDDLSVVNPYPDLDYVKSIADHLHYIHGPSAYSIDIGWRFDLQEYELIELNDAWSLGLYINSDGQSRPITRDAYAEMLISRWDQVLFCNLV